jgi:hypothetical protein
MESRRNLTFRAFCQMLLSVPDDERKIADTIRVFFVGLKQFITAKIRPFGKLLDKLIADLFAFRKSLGEMLLHLLFGKIP